MAIAIGVPALGDVSNARHDARALVALAQKRLELLGRFDSLDQLNSDARELRIVVRIGYQSNSRQLIVSLGAAYAALSSRSPGPLLFVLPIRRLL